MPVIAIAIQKGGSGKTTTTINLGAALMHQGKRVLLVDADPQSNLTQSLGILEEPENNIFSEFKKEMAGEDSDLPGIIIQTKSGLPLVPSSIELASAELEMVSAYGREQLLSWMLKPLEAQYDFIFIDCPPSMGMLTVNALVASQYVIMPLVAEFLPSKGLRSFIHHFNGIIKMKQKLGTNIEILGFVLTRYDDHKKMNREVYQELVEEFAGKVFQTRIRSNIQLAKAQEAGLDIFSFDPTSNGAKDYQSLAAEFLQRFP